MLIMGHRNGHAAILRDVMGDAGVKGWRWTHQHPAFSFKLGSAENLDFYLRFAVNGTTFADTGPVTLTIHINGEVLDRPRFDTPGEREYSHPVPARWLEAKNPAIVEIDVDPVWIAPRDKVPLGIVLIAIGFEESAP
jgi:hypothetical protein